MELREVRLKRLFIAALNLYKETSNTSASTGGIINNRYPI